MIFRSHRSRRPCAPPRPCARDGKVAIEPGAVERAAVDLRPPAARCPSRTSSGWRLDAKRGRIRVGPDQTESPPVSGASCPPRRPPGGVTTHHEEARTWRELPRVRLRSELPIAGHAGGGVWSPRPRGMARGWRRCTRAGLWRSEVSTAETKPAASNQLELFAEHQRSLFLLVLLQRAVRCR